MASSRWLSLTESPRETQDDRLERDFDIAGFTGAGGAPAGGSRRGDGSSCSSTSLPCNLATPARLPITEALRSAARVPVAAACASEVPSCACSMGNELMSRFCDAPLAGRVCLTSKLACRATAQRELGAGMAAWQAWRGAVEGAG